jgi:glycosyltransferase involved in cell wall biosynthesis
MMQTSNREPGRGDDLTSPAAPLGEHGGGSPLVSVVLATFNRAYLLEDTLRMVLAQTLDDFELIVCDDGSTDGTPVVMAEWAVRDRRILYVRQPRNLGLAGNVRRGIDLAKAELVAVLYDGDVYDPRLLEQWVTALRVCPEAAFVFNAYNQLRSDGRIKVTYRERLDSCVPGRVLLERLYFRRWHFSSPVWGTVMLRKSKYIAAGGLDTRFSPVADVDLYLRLAETNCVAYVPEPLIGLASREAVPKLFRPAPKRLVRRAFREARVRHYRGRPLQLLFEMLRHWTFVAVDVAVGSMLTALSGWQGPGPADRLRRWFSQRHPQEGGHACR